MANPMWSTFVELMQFIRTTRNYWLLPIVTALFLLGGLIVFTKGSAVAPFIYALF